ncbi:MAG: DEAD/DEAH box helicase family protein [Myxococcota bacterium]|jgi:superfamily II DNA or RNA helicase|nr:DEAD/DEAH box helicase family protein [Myxococcota bacterium]
MQLRFRHGTLEIGGVTAGAKLPTSCAWDERTLCYRAPASAYAEVVLWLLRAGQPFEDTARAYPDLDATLVVQKEPRPYQREALSAWNARMGRGVVVLPTGAGKSLVAVQAIAAKNRSALVVAPTLDLVRQWYDLLRTSFGVEVAIIGGGDYGVLPLTVTTYDSAYLHMEHLGNRFGLVVFDECHHLPSEAYTLAAQACLAPFRLGLSATPERPDGRHALLDALIGTVVYRKDIVEMTGQYLAEYDVETIAVELSPQEQETYAEARAVYTSFLRQHGIRMNEPDGWTQFVIRASRGLEGRCAMDAYLAQRRLAFGAPSKLEYLEKLLSRHRDDRAILFTQDNATAYEIARRFLVPVITHQTKVKERSEILSGLRSGAYGAIVTSKVLNEGVDVPEANVAVVLSGSGSVREHVQRLGRVLRRKAGGGRAVLYELVAGETSEAHVSRRRREHIAYR